MSTPETNPNEEQPVGGAIDKVSHGQADETPLLALTGVALVVTAFVVVVLAAAFLVYYLV
jgi:hypothetical protein